MFKKLFLNAEKKLSFVKLGGWITSMSLGAIASGIVPPEFIPVVKFIAFLGGGTAITGARDLFPNK